MHFTTFDPKVELYPLWVDPNDRRGHHERHRMSLAERMTFFCSVCRKNTRATDYVRRRKLTRRNQNIFKKASGPIHQAQIA